MADGELGNLRRAPRIIEHKISKQSRYRTEGMAGGQFDAVIPVDVTDTISSLSDSASDGGGPVPEWFTESFTLTSAAAATLTLTYIPVDYSEILTLNGIRLSETTDYTIADNVVTWTSLTDLILGIGSDSWTLTATYPYYDQASDLWTMTPLTSWQLNGNAVVAGSYVTLTPDLTGQAGSAVEPVAVPSGWSTIDMSATVYLSAATADGFAMGLLDSAVYADTYIGVGGKGIGWTDSLGNILAHSSAFYGWTVVFDPSPVLASNLSGAPTSTGAPTPLAGAHVYDITWTVTGTNLATVTLSVDGTLAATLTGAWVPSSPLLALSAGTGAAHNLHQIQAIAVTVT